MTIVSFQGMPITHMPNVYEPRQNKPCNTYPNRYLGQYLTWVRLDVVAPWMLAFARGGLGSGGGGVFLLSLLLSVIVNPRSLLSFRLTLGKK